MLPVFRVYFFKSYLKDVHDLKNILKCSWLFKVCDRFRVVTVHNVINKCCECAGWASLMALGEDGYNQHTRDILETTQAIAKGVQNIRGIRLLGGTPEAMIVCFAGTI